MDNLTTESRYVLFSIYAMYLKQRKEGIAKCNAVRFEEDFYVDSDDKKLSKMNDSDISSALLELAQMGYIKIYIGGNFDLQNSAIIAMEQRFKNGLTDVYDVIKSLIPLIP